MQNDSFLNDSDRHSLLALAGKRIAQGLAVKNQILSEGVHHILLPMAESIVHSFNAGGKLLICGNGGSASDAQHLAAELLIRLRSSHNRQTLPAIALTMDTSTLTACGNDYGFECLYERMVESLGKPQDILLGITTSSRSPNILKAFQKAQHMKIKTFGFLGCGGEPAILHCDKAFIVPSMDTAHIQEAHIMAGHLLMLLIEEIMIKQGTLRVESLVEMEKM